MKRRIVAGNWKMHYTWKEAKPLIEGILHAGPYPDAEVILGVPFTLLAQAVEMTKDSAIAIAAQNCYSKPSGAYTGEISADMLAAIGVQYVILGHSERREHFGEDHALLADKVNAVLAAGLTPIFCCGEPLGIREAGTQEAYVVKQLEESLFHLSAEELSKIYIAYEPIWAIGTGLTASPEQAEEMQASIKALIAKRYDGLDIPVLYGGSVKPDNSATLFAQPSVDGGLVGGASLKADSFIDIICNG